MAKKVLSIALALLMIVNVFAVAVSATEWTTEKAVISLSSDNAKPQSGDTVTVTVSIENNYNVHALQLMLAYDKNYYDVVGTSADEVFTNLLVSDGAKFTGVVQSLLGSDAQNAMYGGLYSEAQKAQYGLLRVGYTWLASATASQSGSVATPVFSTKTNLVSFKLKVKDTAAKDEFGVVMVDPTFVVATGTDVPSFDTRCATYVGKGAATISASATSGKLYGLPIDVTNAKLEACKHTSLTKTDAKEATHKATGNIAYWTCDDCGSIFSDAEAKTEITLQDTVVSTKPHDSKDDISWTSNADNHSKICSCGEELEKAAHTFVWVTDTDSTCDSTGIQHEECSVCGYKRNEGTTLEKKSHNITHINAKAVSCTEDGCIEHYYCDGCKKYYSDAAGTIEIDKSSVVIASQGHQTTKTDAKDADCVNAGNIAYWTCGECNKIFSDEACTTAIELKDTVIAATGHDKGKWSEKTPATMDEPGLKELKCTKCGHVLDTEVIPALGEDPANYDELNALVAQAEALDRDAYTEDSIAAVDAVIAKIDYTLKLSQQATIDGWADELEAALAALAYDVSGAEASVTTVLNKKSVVKDDIVTVSIKLTTNYPVPVLQLPVIYDKTEFELVDFTSGKSYLTFNSDSSFAKGRYDFNGSAGLDKGFKYTSNSEKWNTADAKAQYGYAWITATFNSATNSDTGSEKLAIPNDEVFVTFRLKALKAVDDTTGSVFISPDWTKTSSVKNGQFVIGFSAKEVNTNPLTYVTTGMTYKLETIAEEGYTVSGKVTSYATNSATSATELTKIELIAGGETKYSTSVAGTGAVAYSLEGVADGTYTVKVSKANHATREYTLTVSGSAVTEDLKIHLLGDIDGNGRITTTDYVKVLSHAKGTAALEDYALKCADIDGNGRITTTDYVKVLSHAKAVSLMW